MERIGEENCQSQLRPQFGEEGWTEGKTIVEDVWLLQKVFRILQSDLAVGGGGGGVKGGGAADVKNPPKIQTPAFQFSLWDGRGQESFTYFMNHREGWMTGKPRENKGRSWPISVSAEALAVGVHHGNCGKCWVLVET